MKFKQPKKQTESIGANRLVMYMRAHGWIIDKLGGGPYTVGWPDFFAWHPQHGLKWIETKAPGGKLRKSQIDRFKRWSRAGLDVYVLEDETHYRRLFAQHPNWREYIRW